MAASCAEPRSPPVLHELAAPRVVHLNATTGLTDRGGYGLASDPRALRPAAGLAAIDGLDLDGYHLFRLTARSRWRRSRGPGASAIGAERKTYVVTDASGQPAFAEVSR